MSETCVLAEAVACPSLAGMIPFAMALVLLVIMESSVPRVDEPATTS